MRASLVRFAKLPGIRTTGALRHHGRSVGSRFVCDRISRCKVYRLYLGSFADDWRALGARGRIGYSLLGAHRFSLGLSSARKQTMKDDYGKPHA